MPEQDKIFEGQGSVFSFLKRLIGYATKYPKWFGLFLFWTVLVAAVDAAFPLILRSILDNVVVPGVEAFKNAKESGQDFEIDLNGVWKHGLVFIIVSITQVLAIGGFVYYTGQIEENVLYDLRKKLFRKLQDLSFSFFDKNNSGWLLTRLTSDTDRVTELISWGMLEAVWGISMIVFCLTALFILNWQLGLIVLLSLPFLFAISIGIRLKVLKYSRAARKVNSEMTAFYTEHINGMLVNKSLGREHAVTNEFKGLSQTMKRSSFRAGYYTAMYFPLVVFIGSIAAALVVWWGAEGAIAAKTGFTIGVLAASFDYAMKIFFPILDLSLFYARAQGSLSAGERIFGLLDEKPLIKNTAEPKYLDLIIGEIEFKGVNFSYGTDKPVLSDFDLEIKARTSVALVGPTGEGKSTIGRLIARFYEVEGGSLHLDGNNIKDLDLVQLRRSIGLVPQDPHLFKGTILENLHKVRPEVEDEKIREIFRSLSASEWISRLDQEVGESGNNLSLGERQLISIVRVLVADPPVLILDEATASVDTITERQIQKGLEELIKGRTSITIAHRLSTIRNCDRILFIKEGKIVEDGTHEELFQKKGYYADLVDHLEE